MNIFNGMWKCWQNILQSIPWNAVHFIRSNRFKLSKWLGKPPGISHGPASSTGNEFTWLCLSDVEQIPLHGPEDDCPCSPVPGRTGWSGTRPSGNTIRVKKLLFCHSYLHEVGLSSSSKSWSNWSRPLFSSSGTLDIS